MVQLATGMMEIVQPEAQAKNITFTHYASEEPLLMDVDRQHMERVILNLISNAVKYTPSGGSIHVDMTRDDQEILLKVVDTGYGIPVDELPFIFERFRRVEQLKDKAVGTGLGLAITKALVENMAVKSWSKCRRQRQHLCCSSATTVILVAQPDPHKVDTRRYCLQQHLSPKRAVASMHLPPLVHPSFHSFPAPSPKFNLALHRT